MRTFFALLKKDFNFQNISLKAIWHEKQRRKKLFMIPIFIVSLAFYWYMFTTQMLGQYGMFQQAGIEYAFVMQGYYTLILLCAVFTTPYVISKIYFGNDISLLFSLPIKPRTILLEKIAILVCSSASLGSLITAPMLVKHGMESHQNVWYYATGIFNILSISILAVLFLVSVIVLLMRKASKFSGLKKSFEMLGMVLIMVIVLTMNTMMQGATFSSVNPLAAMDFAKQSLATHNTMLRYLPVLHIVKYVQFLQPGTLGFALSFVFLAACVALAYSISIALSNTMRIGVLQSASSGTSKTKRVLKVKEKSVFSTLYSKELKEIFTTPVYLFNTIGGAIIMPIAMIVPSYMQLKEQLKNFDFGAVRNFFLKLFPHSQLLAVSVLIGVALACFIGTMCNIASSTFSREGNKITLVQSLPISAKTQIGARLLASLTLQFASVLPVVVVFHLLIARIEYTAAVLVGMLAGDFFLSSFGLLLDVFHPKLKWNNPQEVLKQNLTVMICIFGGMAVGGFMIFGFFKYILNTEYMLAYGIAVPALLFVLGLLFYIVSRKILPRRLYKYSVE